MNQYSPSSAKGRSPTIINRPYDEIEPSSRDIQSDMAQNILSLTADSPLVESPMDMQDDNSPICAYSSATSSHESAHKSSTILPQKRRRPSYEASEDKDERRTSKPRYLSDKVNGEKGSSQSMSLHVDVKNISPLKLESTEEEKNINVEEGVSNEESKPLRPSSAPQEPRISTSKSRANSSLSRPNTQGACPSSHRHRQLGISHIDLLYVTDNGVMSCRMCL